MHVTIVGEDLKVLQAARQAFWPLEIKVSFAGCQAELGLVFETSGLPEMLVVNLSDKLTAEDLAMEVEKAGYQGRLLLFTQSPPDSRLTVPALDGAEYLVRPASEARTEELLRAAILRHFPPTRASKRLAACQEPPHHGIVGNSPKLREIFTRMEKVAGGDASVCIYGESGTGKEMIARAVHFASPRRDRPLITLDCTTIPDGLMESHLLGHVKGAFTGAVEHRQGVFALAHTGTLFIDELSELSLPLQAKLLRVVQHREFVPVGGTKPVRSDIRLITASNKDLKREVEKGTFREDLYYRVAVFMITVPPLRERKDDIPRLVEHFLRKFAVLYGKPLRGVEPGAMKRMLGLPWPGNVRQLENLLEQAIVLADGDTLTERDLFAAEGSSSQTPSALAPGRDCYEPGLPLHEVERRHILGTLAAVGGHRTEAARQLGISLRCLQYKLKEYGASAADLL